MISIICPIYNEEKYISSCIESILGQDYPKDDLEVLFVDGMSTDKTRSIIRKYIQDYPFIQLLDNPGRVVPPAMNIGIRRALGEIIIRLDAHAIYPPNYFSVLVKQLDALKADNVGGVCQTLPVKKTTICKAIATALSSSFGMGNSYFRVGAREVMQVDTVPFGCFRKELFDKIGYFDEELVRNQDDEFNGRIIKYGGKIFLLPSLVIKYYARDTITKVRKMFYQYGLFKPLVNKKLGSPATTRQFFPLLFVLGLILGLGLSFIHPVIAYSYISVLLFYILLAFLFGFKDSKNLKQTLILPWIFFMIHVSYGWGYLTGLYKITFHKSFTAKVNR